VISVVKANAYGHGAGQVALALEEAGADCSPAPTSRRARAARGGVRGEILVFGALSVSDLDGLFDCRLTPTISTPGAARAVQAAAASTSARPLSPEDRHRHEPARLPLRQPAPDAARTAGEPNLELEAVYTHFATADDPESPLFNEQRVRFERARAEIDEMTRRAQAREDHAIAARVRRRLRPRREQRRAAARLARLVRPRAPGLLLYGIVPPPLASTLRSRRS
jgi:alanine racemase